MSISRRARWIPLALVIVLLVSVQTASASHPVDVQRYTTIEHIPFTIDPAACEQIVDPISGVAEFRSDVTITTYADGSRQIVDVGTSSGPAYDPNGKHYRFRYTNTAVYTVPVDGTVVVVQMEDVFTLRGGNRANRIYASFDWLWTFPAELAGDYPFAASFPPADNWVQFETTGNPLGCDPI